MEIKERVLENDILAKQTTPESQLVKEMERVSLLLYVIVWRRK